MSDILNTSSVRLLGEQRLKGMPNVPMLSELPGLSGFNVSSWNALAAPGKMRKAVVEHLSSEVANMMVQPDTVQRLAGFNVRAQSSSLAQLARLLEREMARWSEVIQKAGIALQK